MRLVLIFSLTIFLLIMSSCSTNENDPIVTDDPESDPISLTVNAAEVYYLSLAQKNTVAVVDPMLENSWDIAIDNLTHISVNGGSTAPGKVYVHTIETENYSQITAAPDGMYNTDTHDDEVIGENWYFYDVRLTL